MYMYWINQLLKLHIHVHMGGGGGGGGREAFNLRSQYCALDQLTLFGLLNTIVITHNGQSMLSVHRHKDLHRMGLAYSNELQ